MSYKAEFLTQQSTIVTVFVPGKTHLDEDRSGTPPRTPWDPFKKYYDI